MKPNISSESWKKCDVLWFALCLLTSSLWCLAAARVLGATFDEKFYLTDGLGWWRGETFRVLSEGTMPLPVDVQTLPLRILEILQGHPIEIEQSFQSALFIARSANLIFWWILLYYGWQIGRELGGRLAGNLGVAFLSCEPNLLANASLATTDIALVACLMGFTFHYLHRGKDWKTRILWPMLWLWLAMASKVSGLFFAVAIVMAIEIGRVLQEQINASLDSTHPWKEILKTCAARIFNRRRLRDWTIMGSGALFLTILYCGCGNVESQFLMTKAAESPPGFLHDIWVKLARRVTISPTAFDAVYFQWKHNKTGHNWYLLGRSSQQGSIWYYFPVLLVLKASLPLMLAAVVTVVRPRNWLTWIGLCIFALLLLSLNYKVQNGVRHMLLLISFLTLLIASGWGQLILASPPGSTHSKWPKFVLGGLLAGMAVQAALIWPHGLTYVNPFWTTVSASQGYRLVSSANYDWGQGLPELRKWQQEHRAQNLVLWYYGTDPLLPTVNAEIWPPDTKFNSERELRQKMQGRYLAISTTLLYGSYSTAICNEQFCNAGINALRKMQPAAHTTTFIIYNFKKQQ